MICKGCCDLSWTVPPKVAQQVQGACETAVSVRGAGRARMPHMLRELRLQSLGCMVTCHMQQANRPCLRGILSLQTLCSGNSRMTILSVTYLCRWAAGLPPTCVLPRQPCHLALSTP